MLDESHVSFASDYDLLPARVQPTTVFPEQTTHI